MSRHSYAYLGDISRSARRRRWLTAWALLATVLAPPVTARAQSALYPYGLPPATAQGVSQEPAATLPEQSNGSGLGTGNQASGGQGGTSTSGAPGLNQPISLVDPRQREEDDASPTNGRVRQGAEPEPPLDRSETKAQPNEFERYVKALLGRSVPRFGATLLTREARTFEPPPTTTVPPDYALNPGDVLRLQLTGAVESEMKLTIDSNGRVFIPKVGSVSLAGVRFGDVKPVLAARIGRQFRNFTVSVAVERLHAIRVYVTGYAARPGAYNLSSLSTLVNAVLAAGGPSPGGSFRNVELRRNGQIVSQFDLYDLLLRGDKTRDVSLQNEDVLYIAPSGPEIAITGSVNLEGIYESREGETLGDALRYAGGVASLADSSRTVVQRLSNLDRAGWLQLDMSATLTTPVERGDVLRVLSTADIARPRERQAVLVTIEGEVGRPGRYMLAPGSTVADLLRQAGGLTDKAFVFGSEFDRISIQRQQQAGFDKAIQNLELAVAAAPASVAYGDAGAQANARTARAAASRAVIDQLKARKPDGRMVLALSPDAQDLPQTLALENDDRIFVPAAPSTVGVFGAVYQQGSFLFRPKQTIGDYLRLAGGPQRLSERSDVFVVRADGSVVSRQQHRWSKGFYALPALPGDVVFVPIKTDPNSTWDKLKDITTVVYQLGLGAAALKVLSQ